MGAGSVSRGAFAAPAPPISKYGLGAAKGTVQVVVALERAAPAMKWKTDQVAQNVPLTGRAAGWGRVCCAAVRVCRMHAHDVQCCRASVGEGLGVGAPAASRCARAGAMALRGHSVSKGQQQGAAGVKTRLRGGLWKGASWGRGWGWGSLARAVPFQRSSLQPAHAMQLCLPACCAARPRTRAWQRGRAVGGWGSEKQRG